MSVAGKEDATVAPRVCHNGVAVVRHAEQFHRIDVHEARKRLLCHLQVMDGLTVLTWQDLQLPPPKGGGPTVNVPGRSGWQADLSAAAVSQDQQWQQFLERRAYFETSAFSATCRSTVRARTPLAAPWVGAWRCAGDCEVTPQPPLDATAPYM